MDGHHTMDNIGQTPGDPYRGYGYFLLRFRGNVVRRMGTQQQPWITVQSDIANDPILFIDHCDIYFMVH